MSDKAAGAVPSFKKSVAREYLESIVVAVILALFIRTFAVQAFKIPTGSMIPNLLIGDHLLVNKLVYSPSFGPLEDALLGKRPIRRGDVVVFKYPEDPSRDFIKRVIGLPGETIEVRGRKVLVDGRGIDEPYAHFLNEQLAADDPEYALREDGRGGWGPQRVPEGKLLVLGDNRDNSRDSRYWGFLPRENVKGRALLVYWSYDADSQEYQETGTVNWLKSTARAFGRTRWDRFFHVIR
jgi:signal peptidase I